MDKELETLCAKGLSFFGIANRLISHALRNNLAIISETSGLANDLLELSQRSKKLDRVRLKSLNESIIEEVRRANALVGHMNAFAHSVDEIIGSVDISQTVGVIIEFARLGKYGKGTKLLFSETNATLYTSPFFLGNLIYDVIVIALEAPGPGKEIRISIHPDAGGFKILLSGIAPNAAEQFSTENIAFLAKALHADISFNSSSGGLNILLPKRMGESVIQKLSLDE